MDCTLGVGFHSTLLEIVAVDFHKDLGEEAAERIHAAAEGNLAVVELVDIPAVAEGVHILAAGDIVADIAAVAADNSLVVQKVAGVAGVDVGLPKSAGIGMAAGAGPGAVGGVGAGAGAGVGAVPEVEAAVGQVGEHVAEAEVHVHKALGVGASAAGLEFVVPRKGHTVAEKAVGEAAEAEGEVVGSARFHPGMTFAAFVQSFQRAECEGSAVVAQGEVVALVVLVHWGELAAQAGQEKGDG